MPKKLVAAVVLAALVIAVAVVGFAAVPSSAIQPIAADSPCPAAGCASGVCHGFDAVPESDGVHEMTCPEASCASVEFAHRALPPGLRHVAERVDSHARGAGAGFVAACAPHGSPGSRP